MHATMDWQCDQPFLRIAITTRRDADKTLTSGRRDHVHRQRAREDLRGITITFFVGIVANMDIIPGNVVDRIDRTDLLHQGISEHPGISG